jgi:hypothetical protein
MPVVLQCLLVSHLLWLLARHIAPTLTRAQFLGMVGWLAAFSSLPYFTGFIMADIFTPILCLCMVLLAFYPAQLGRYGRLYLMLLASIATVSHITNLPLAMGMLLVLMVLLWQSAIPMRELRHQLLLLLTPIVLTLMALFSYNVVIFKNWTISSAGQSFFMANLIEYGPARTYLQEACPEAGYRICAVADALPPTAEDLLWFTDIFHDLGGFAAMREESAAIVKQTVLTRPMEVATMAGDNFLHALTRHEPAAEFIPQNHIPSMEGLLRDVFGPATLAAYQNSAQMRDTIPHRTLATLDSILTPLAFCVLLGIAIAHRKKRDTPSFLFAATVICFVLGNTLLCSALSGVHDRYQSRVTWLMPMAVILLLAERKNRTRAAASSPHTP